MTDKCPIFREGMRSVLIEQGYEVDVAHSNPEFYKLFSPEYDLMIMDLDIMGTLAIELGEHVYAATNPYMNKPNKIIATYNEGVRYCRGDLFDHMIKKPFTKEKLLETVNKEYVNARRFKYQRDSQNSGNVQYQRMV